jgi:hypothetical protein
MTDDEWRAEIERRLDALERKHGKGKPPTLPPSLRRTPASPGRPGLTVSFDNSMKHLELLARDRTAQSLAPAVDAGIITAEQATGLLDFWQPSSESGPDAETA